MTDRRKRKKHRVFLILYLSALHIDDVVSARRVVGNSSGTTPRMRLVLVGCVSSSPRPVVFFAGSLTSHVVVVQIAKMIHISLARYSPRVTLESCFFFSDANPLFHRDQKLELHYM